MSRYALALAMLALVPAALAGQQPTRRRQAPIVIRGQVPTPQVVTVRPRAVPAYSRQVLVPRFYDHDFWPEIEQSYQLVPERLLRGDARLDSLAAGSDSSGSAAVTESRPHGTPRPDSAPPAAGTAPARRP